MGVGASVWHTSVPSDARVLPARAHSPLHEYSHPARSHCTNVLLAQSVLFFTPYTPLGMHLSCMHLWPACTLPPLTYTLCTCAWLLNRSLQAQPPAPLHPKPCLHTPNTCTHITHACILFTQTPYLCILPTYACNLCMHTLSPYSCIHLCMHPSHACTLLVHASHPGMQPTHAHTPSVFASYLCMHPTCANTLLVHAPYSYTHHIQT